jgi:hypothetical protein
MLSSLTKKLVHCRIFASFVQAVFGGNKEFFAPRIPVAACAYAYRRFPERRTMTPRIPHVEWRRALRARRRVLKASALGKRFLYEK